LFGKGGPKAAGRAAKEVLLSSVRLMAAFGGKRVKGVLKEKKEVSRDLVGAVEGAMTGADRAMDATERQKRKMEAAKKRTRMTIRGGRILKI
jgi:hypothetical protein